MRFPRLFSLSSLLFIVVFLVSGCLLPSVPSPSVSPPPQGNVVVQGEANIENAEVLEGESPEEEFEFLEDGSRVQKSPGVTLTVEARDINLRGPLGGVTITLTPSGETEPRYEGVTNDSGQCFFPDVEPGKYQFVARKNWYRDITRTITLRSNATVKLSMKATFIKGKVLEKKSGRPMGGVTVTLSGFFGSTSCTTQDDGTYFFNEIQWSNPSGESYTLEASKDNYKPVMVTFTMRPYTSKTVNFKMEEGSWWTVLVYMCVEDPELEQYANQDLQEMEGVAYSPRVQVVVQLDTPGSQGTFRYRMRSGGRDLVATLPEQNMASPSVLKDFVTWAMRNYPARHYLLVLWGHGAGWLRENVPTKGIIPDDTSQDIMSMGELVSALNGIPGKVDILAFGSCLMQMMEVAYEITSRVSSAKCPNYLIGSEEVMWALGFPYDSILSALVTNPAVSSRDFACLILNEYLEFYTGWQYITLSVLDLAKFRASAKTVLDNFAVALLQSPAQQAIFDAASQTQSYDPSRYYQYKDLYDFASRVWSISGCGTAAQEVMSFVKSVVVAEGHSADLPGSHGLSIYLPTGADDISSAYFSLAFARDTRWDDFIKRSQQRVRIVQAFTSTWVYSSLSQSIPSMRLKLPKLDVAVPQHILGRNLQQQRDGSVERDVWIVFQSFPGARGYKLYRSTDGVNFVLWKWGECPGCSGLIAFLDSSVTEGSTYYYYVTAYSSGWETPPSDILTVIPYFLPPVYLEEPSNGSTVTESTPTFRWSVEGAWNGPRSDLYTSITVFDNTYSANVWGYSWPGIDTTGATYDGSPLQNGHQYFWFVDLYASDRGELTAVSWSDMWYFSYFTEE